MSIPAISDHFIERARERAPWLLNLEDLQAALSQSSEITLERSIWVRLKYDDKKSQYRLVPKLSTNRKSVVLVLSDNTLVTVYRADSCGWLRGKR
ncbi:MAG: hypothetical protein SV201_04985 [Pseudomonadota bacterium]|nr:hypothetical protein [Pseudomonadota bacterium]